MRHVSRTHRLTLNGLFRNKFEPKSQIKYVDTKTNSQTYWQREISHVMNGIIFCVCSTSAISVTSIVLKRCRKERKKMQMKKESQQNQSRWWIWYDDTAWGIRTCLSRLHRKVRWKSNLKVQNVQLSSINVQQTSTMSDRWSKDEGYKSSFCLTDWHLSFEECRIGDKAPKIQRSSCTPRRHCERWFWIVCSIYRTRIISITNDGSKNHGYHLQIAGVAMDKQQTQYQLILK